MLFRCDKTSEAGPEIVPGIFRVESAERGIGTRVAGTLLGLLGLAAAVWFDHIAVRLPEQSRGAAWGVLICIFLVLMLLFELSEDGLLDDGVARLREFLRGRLRGRDSVERQARRPVSTFLFLIVPKRSREHLVGDLEEEYRTEVIDERTRFRAMCWWWGQVLGIVEPYIWKRVRQLLGVEIVRGWRRR